jgi:hypothetical protein
MPTPVFSLSSEARHKMHMYRWNIVKHNPTQAITSFISPTTNQLTHGIVILNSKMSFTDIFGSKFSINIRH